MISISTSWQNEKMCYNEIKVKESQSQRKGSLILIMVKIKYKQGSVRTCKITIRLNVSNSGG